MMTMCSVAKTASRDHGGGDDATDATTDRATRGSATDGRATDEAGDELKTASRR